MITKQELIQYIDEIIEGCSGKTIPEKAGAYCAALTVVKTHLECESIVNTFESQWTNKVEQEKMELCNRICNLTDFLKDTEKTADLSPHMLYLLRDQLKTMKQYYYILEARLKERLKEGEDE